MLPCLVNVATDAAVMGALTYRLRVGDTVAGTRLAQPPVDLQLPAAPGVRERHCVFTVTEQAPGVHVVAVRALGDAEVCVAGALCPTGASAASLPVRHGETVALGSALMLMLRCRSSVRVAASPRARSAPLPPRARSPVRCCTQAAVTFAPAAPSSRPRAATEAQAAWSGSPRSDAQGDWVMARAQHRLRRGHSLSAAPAALGARWASSDSRSDGNALSAPAAAFDLQRRLRSALADVMLANDVAEEMGQPIRFEVRCPCRGVAARARPEPQRLAAPCRWNWCPPCAPRT